MNVELLKRAKLALLLAFVLWSMILSAIVPSGTTSGLSFRRNGIWTFAHFNLSSDARNVLETQLQNGLRSNLQLDFHPWV